MSLMCFDFGLRQIGVAVGNLELGTVQPLTTLMAKDGMPQWHEIEALLQEWKPERVVVGRPFNMDGSESEMSARAKKFANRIHGRFGVPIALHDERLTSQEAKYMAREKGHKGDYSRAPIDALAASLILESYIAMAGASESN